MRLVRAAGWWLNHDIREKCTRASGPLSHQCAHLLGSSQVACVNFLLPLASSAESLTAVLRVLDDDIVSVAPMEYDVPKTGLRCASFVELEWVGLGSTLEGAAATRGANVTSADALVIGITADGRRRAYVFEWKNAESYPNDEYKGHGSSGDKRRQRYSSMYAAPDSPFNGEVPIDAMLYEPFYQLMRLGLLGAKMVREAEFGVSEARVVVACPAANVEYRNRVTSPELRSRPGKTVESVMNGLARIPDAFRVVDHAMLAAVFRQSTAR